MFSTVDNIDVSINGISVISDISEFPMIEIPAVFYEKPRRFFEAGYSTKGSENTHHGIELSRVKKEDFCILEQHKNIIKISVRNFVEFLLRTGDIDSRMTGKFDKELMQKGSRMHRKIQRKMSASYQAEVPVKFFYSCHSVTLQLEGRADGVIHTEEGIIIDEIKTTFIKLDYITEPIREHLAQAKCYAYAYVIQENLKEITVQMTYCNLDTEEIKRFQIIYTEDELQDWFRSLALSYEKWANFQIEWRKQRNDSIQQTQFPYPYRKEQRKLVASVYRTIERKKKLFIQASTGVGKTIAAIFPAVRAIGAGLGEKLFYLTAKTITRTAAQQAFSLLKKEGLAFKALTLTAKEKICFCEETECNPDVCPYAKGHFDRVNDAIYELITGTDLVTREELKNMAEKYRVCPFELSLDASEWMDAVICDYNYVFDPNAHLKRFFSDSAQTGYLFLIDEAHNLVERGRDMYSAEICKEEVLSLKKIVRSEAPGLSKILDECNRQLLALKRECESYCILDSVSHIALKFFSLSSEIEKYLEEYPVSLHREAILEFYFKVRKFLNIYEILDENYMIYTQFTKNQEFILRLFCINPAENLNRFLSKGNSVIYFSATLLPIEYYKNLLSTQTDDYTIYAQSSFPDENRLIILGVDVTSRYTKRNLYTYKKYADYILKTIHIKKGNYIVFFPSYHFLEEVFQCFRERVESEEYNESDSVDWVVQSQYMSEESREIFLENFEEERSDSLVGFCVMGGIFSEGIDLTKDKLIGTIIIGTGLPQVCIERELLKQYFDKNKLSGFEYAYLYPGMNKVLQSAGRVIRTEEDKGVILLLDERFADESYQRGFPREWKQFYTCNLQNIETILKNFWLTKNNK